MNACLGNGATRSGRGPPTSMRPEKKSPYLPACHRPTCSNNSSLRLFFPGDSRLWQVGNLYYQKSWTEWDSYFPQENQDTIVRITAQWVKILGCREPRNTTKQQTSHKRFIDREKPRTVTASAWKSELGRTQSLYRVYWELGGRGRLPGWPGTGEIM